MTALRKKGLSQRGSVRTLRLVRAVAVICLGVVLASGLSSTVASAAPLPREATGSAGGARRSIPAGQLGGPFTAASVRSAEVVLAQSGVATVADEGSKAPLVSVTGPVRLRFTRAQVQAMALSAADGGGLLGSTLGSVTPVAKGVAPFGYVLAAWLRNEATPGAEAVRALMGPQDWKAVPSVVFPTIALPLFAADVIAHTPAHAGSPRPALVADEVEDEQHMGFFDAPCSTVSDFVQSTLASVFNALQLAPATGSGAGATIGNFFVTLWNGVVVLAQRGVQRLVDKLSQFIVSKIELAAGAVVVIANIVAYLNPWSVSVSGLPDVVLAGGSGVFRAKVSTVGLSAWPSAIVDCLPSGVTLPPLQPVNADATWTVQGPLSASSPTTIKISPLGQGQLYFTTTRTSTPAGCSSGAASPQTASATITVQRPGTSQLKEVVINMVSNGFGLAGSIVRPVVQAILEPILDLALNALAKLTQVHGKGYVTISDAGPGGGHCTTTTGVTTTTNSACKYVPPPPPCPYISLAQIEKIYSECVYTYDYSVTTGAKTIPPSCVFTFELSRSVTVTFMPPAGGGELAYGCTSSSFYGETRSEDIAAAAGGWTLLVQAFIGGCGEATAVAQIALQHVPR